MHHLLTSRETVETPAMAATLLLRWLSLCVFISLVMTAGFYLVALLGDDISQHRREMNAAAYRAQLYFDQREALLNYLADSVVETPTPSASQDAVARDGIGDVQRLALGQNQLGKQLSLLLSARAERTLAEFGAHLIHVSTDPDQPRQWLHSRETPASAPPAELDADMLARHAAQSPETNRIHWRASAGGRSIYLYRSAEDGPTPSHWLVLSLDANRVARWLDRGAAGDVFLLDQDDHPVLSSRRNDPDRGWISQNAQHQDSFVFAWTGGQPRGLVLVKGIGQGGWRLVYHVSGQRLLHDIAIHLAVSLLLCLVSFVALRMLMRRLDRQLVQPALHQHRQLLDSIAFGSTVIEMAPVGMCVLRCRDSKVMLENQLARDWLGGDTDAGDWTGPWRQVGGADPHASRFRRAVDFTTGEGRMLQALYAATRYHDEDVLLCVFHDISRHRQIQTTLSAAKQAADDASQAKSAFVATMSHEIRTPLYGVLGTLELLGNTELDARQAQYLRTIEQSSSVLLQLISDILDVSKIESGQLSLATTLFSPVELAETTLRSYAAAAAQKNLQILVSTDADMPEHVIGDAGRIRQVLGNLLSNAIKFTDQGRIFLRVRQLTCEGGVASISWQVTNTGIGIPASEHARLFEPFRQVFGQRTQDGAGLGLSISNHLVRLMNGEMHLISEPGLGSSFTVVLPLLLSDTFDAPAEPSRHPKLQSHPVVYVRAPLVELADSLCQWLQRWGASARRYSIDAPPSSAGGAILLDCDPRDPVAIQWRGPRVVAVPDAGVPHSADGQHDDCLTASVFSVHEIAEAVARVQRGLPAPAATPPRPPQKPLDLCALVVEDNPINRQILKEHLETLGCRVITARDGHEALGYCATEALDVVLTDINMPGLDGHGLIRELRKRGFSQPVIGASANATPEERERCLVAGMNGYLVKPIDIGTLRHTLGTLVPGTQP